MEANFQNRRGQTTPSKRFSYRYSLKNKRDSSLEVETGRKVATLYLRYSPHIPRRGAPQGQGPASLDNPSREVPATANADNSFST
jgi:hypothetical protein